MAEATAVGMAAGRVAATVAVRVAVARAAARAAAAWVEEEEVEGTEVGKHPPRACTSCRTRRRCPRQPRIPLRMRGPRLAK